MIQLNLLPDVKTKYIKAEASKKRIIFISILVSGISVGVILILGSYVYLGQKYQLSSLDKKIKTNSQKLKDINGLDKILTIQNQLNSLPSLHDQKPVTSRLFAYLPQITPNDVQISSLDLQYEDSTIQIVGVAKTLEAVNKFVDTLKFTEYNTDQNKTNKTAFSKVVLASFGVTDKEITYTIDMNFDTAIFSSDAKKVTFVIPKITSTRSQVEQPDALFKSNPTSE
jgi:Tfp pilus assembly protein PilN